MEGRNPCEVLSVAALITKACIAEGIAIMNSIVMPLASPVAKLRCFKPSRAQEDFVHDGLQFLQLTSPFWSSLFYSTLPVKYTYDIPRLATDGHYVYVNPDGMRDAKWTFENVAFGLAHEDFHYILNDLIMGMVWKEGGVPCQSGMLPYDHMLMNQAMDYRINAALIDAKVGTFPPEGLYDPSLSRKGDESCLEIYEKLWKRNQGKSQPEPDDGEGEGGGEGGDGAGEDHGGFDIHLEPSEETIEAEKRGGEMRRAQAIASAKMVAEAAGMGDLPAAIRSLIGEILSPTVRWQDHLKSAMHRAAGEPKHNWAQLNKRLISRPAPYSKIAFARREEYGCGQVVVMYDTSGSCIDETVQTKFFSEMAGIVADLNPSELVVIWCDAEVQRIDRLEEPTDLEHLRMEINDLGGAPGGGGTDFRPPFQWVRDEHIEPDMVVYLTDTYGLFPEETPDYPVIWCSLIENPRVPWGEVVEIKD